MEWRFPDTGLATCKCDSQPQLDRIKAAEISKTVRSKNKCFHHLTSVLGIHSNTYPTQHLFFLHRSRYDKSCHLIWVLPVKSARDVKNRKIPRWKLTQLYVVWSTCEQFIFSLDLFIVLSSLWFQEKKNESESLSTENATVLKKSRASLISSVKRHAKQPVDVASSLTYKDLNNVRGGGHDLYFWMDISSLSVFPYSAKKKKNILWKGGDGALLVPFFFFFCSFVCSENLKVNTIFKRRCISWYSRNLSTLIRSK